MADDAALAHVLTEIARPRDRGNPFNAGLAAALAIGHRMQGELPPEIDLAQESAATQSLYGIGPAETDDFGFEAVEGQVHIHDWHATLLHLLGLDRQRLTFPHADRDMRLTDVKGTMSMRSSPEAGRRTGAPPAVTRSKRTMPTETAGSRGPRRARQDRRTAEPGGGPKAAPRRPRGAAPPAWRGMGPRPCSTGRCRR